MRQRKQLEADLQFEAGKADYLQVSASDIWTPSDLLSIGHFGERDHSWEGINYLLRSA